MSHANVYFFVKLPNSHTIGFNLQNSTTGTELKKTCWERTQTMFSWEDWNRHIYIVYGGKIYTDEKTLAQMGITYESTINLYVRVLSCQDCQN